MSHPAVFISYSHDSQEHKLWVLNLATRLRNNGVDAMLDQWDLGPGGDLPHFMEQSISRSSRVLMICTERYVDKANAGTGGVGYEKMIMTSDLVARIGSNKVIPIVRQSGLPRLPIFVSSKLYIDLSTADKFETGFDQVLRELLNAPLFQKPPLGVAPTLTATSVPSPTLPDPLTQFMMTLESVYDKSSSAGAIRTELVFEKMNVSKLMFDYAFDLAQKNDFVHAAGPKDVFWVQPAGRARMLELHAQRNNGAA
jgi:TIR domain